MVGAAKQLQQTLAEWGSGLGLAMKCCGGLGLFLTIDLDASIVSSILCFLLCLKSDLSRKSAGAAPRRRVWTASSILSCSFPLSTCLV